MKPHLKFFSTHPPSVAATALYPSPKLDRTDRRAPTSTPCPLSSVPSDLSLSLSEQTDLLILFSVLSLFFFFSLLSFFPILIWMYCCSLIYNAFCFCFFNCCCGLCALCPIYLFIIFILVITYKFVFVYPAIVLFIY